MKRVQKDRHDAAVEVVATLREHGVQLDEIEKFIGHSIDDYTEADDMALRGILNSAAEGIDPHELLDAPHFEQEEPETGAPIREDGGGAFQAATAMTPVSDPAVVLTHRSEPLDPDDDRGWTDR